jgi:hypothetical protein
MESLLEGQSCSIGEDILLSSDPTFDCETFQSKLMKLQDLFLFPCCEREFQMLSQIDVDECHELFFYL